MSKVRRLWSLLILSILPCVVIGQSKKFACSFAHPEAVQMGYLPEYVPLEICTHVIFKWFHFPQFVGRQMLFKDNDKIAFSRLVSSVRKRSNTARVVASIDGSGADYSSTSGTNARRRAFVKAISALFLELDADVVELNWERQSNENTGTGPDSDRFTMLTLLQDLRQVVNSVGSYIKGRTRELWIRGPIRPTLISTAYNPFDVCELVDHVTLESKHAFHAPIYSRKITFEIIGGIYINIKQAGDGFTQPTQLWIDYGCPPKKLLLGIGFHGFLKTVSSSDIQFFGTDYFYWGSGNETSMAYRELCQALWQPGWRYGWDMNRLNPNATISLPNGKSEQLNYEDVNSLRYKLDLVESKRLGGVYIDFIHSDDIYGSCGQAYALSGYIAHRLQAISSDIGFAIEWSK